MASEDITQALESARLELEYERALQGAERIYEDERARVLRVQLLLLEGENDEAREQLEKDQDELQRSEDVAQDLHDRFADLEEQYEHAQAELKACMRDIDQYQAEINALNASSSDTNKILTEKLALSRELNALKPELDHLRSQVASQEKILADKLSLQRELNTAQLELENEKKTVQRLKQRSNSGDAVLAEEVEDLKKELAEEKKATQKLKKQTAKRANEKSTADAALVDELETLRQELVEAQQKLQKAEGRAAQPLAATTDPSEIEELRKELAKAQKNVQKAERDNLKKSTEWSTQKETLESKLDAFRTKLRTTKEQLKEAQDELERREAAKFAESAKLTAARMQGRHQQTVTATTEVQPQLGVSANPRKRNVARFDPDMTIGTPGHAAVKKPRTTMSIVRDKSTFSITPFLNRTQSILPDSPAEDVHEKIDEAINTTINELAEEAEKESSTQKATQKGIEKKPQTQKDSKKASVAGKKLPEPNPTSTALSKSTASLKETAAPRGNKSAKEPSLSKVIEEEGCDSENQPQEASTNPQAAGTTDPNAAPATKKKKLLGGPRNIFDDDEVDGLKKKVTLGGPRLGKVSLGGFNRAKPKMLAEFSPLKKDRRVPGNMTTMIEA
ncbi:hypothetical protein H2198_007363 [Neophaeococcomyces mojaviensis]|uniref:Uncharacterized protein n=1 Tax=Neophaeococcomyces mojaviensis TaxID=3383035 RepID=A0ACC3A0F0_9EURO|nr:hypothetical protein H2198_007363 [Knufia sp. JES_112]